ncbi:MAG TPA: thiol:disulfide interchange protein DsbA/DsbL [Leucothrix sp.]|nr:thiol:disulfide interchange protein DsbA/DsbL [Leucothrix sp.]
MMIINKKIIMLIMMPLFLAVACGSNSSDAKKVETNNKEESKESTTEQQAATALEAPTQEAATKPAKTLEPKKLAMAEFVEGKHYVKISPEMQTDAPEGKVEVVELMWLGCGHCYTLEPAMLEYKKNHPEYVDFKQVPAMLNPSWAKDASIYYLAEILDPTGEKELVIQLFQAIHDQRRNLRNPDTVIRLFKQFGYTEEQIKNVKSSMAFQAKLKRAHEIGEASQAQSVPAVIINGKYRTSVYMAGSEEMLFKVIDMLTAKEHK